ncbi:hypothetical protein F7Q95_15745 [Pseudomonas psychrophila]|nr:hypothetical protein F7Q95_15745 [Pseudomonas psychrophila]
MPALGGRGLARESGDALCQSIRGDAIASKPAPTGAWGDFEYAGSPETASVLRRQPHPARPVVRGKSRRGHLPAGPQWRG